MIKYLIACLFVLPLYGETLYLKNSLNKAKKGDYVVTAQAKDLTLWHIQDRNDDAVLIEEITIPQSRAKQMSWKEWVKQRAPYHVAWVVYAIELKTGKLLSYYNVDSQCYVSVKKEDPFLTTLLNLPFTQMPLNTRKRIGSLFDRSDDPRNFWQPPMIVNGKRVDDVFFDHFRTVWPNDRSQLAGKNVEIYLPTKDSPYPAYFPYWLQISGGFGKARLRIVDTGNDMESAIPSMWPLEKSIP